MSLKARRNIRNKTYQKASTPQKSKTAIFQNISRSRMLPFLVAFCGLGILFVLIRMKAIEQDYKLNEISKLHKKRVIENKELKADKARLLSIKRLELFAQKYELKEPDEKHIIIIPE